MIHHDKMPCGCEIIWSDEENKGMIVYCNKHQAKEDKELVLPVETPEP